MTKKVRRLYKKFHPANYSLHLIIDKKNMLFSGTVKIRGSKIGRPTERIVMHQKQLNISSAEIIKHGKNGDIKLAIERINKQDTFDEVRIHSSEKIVSGDYTLILKFSGHITKSMNGIYPCFYKISGKEEMLIATQFESHHAREAFPCIDEPEAKATFDLIIETSVNDEVVANTPVLERRSNDDTAITTFETTPIMSTYLLAFACGDLKYKEAQTSNGVIVRAYTTPDKVSLTGHSLNVAVKALDFFSDYFGVPYPLPKLDMLALPDFSSGAMENWGLVTYRETAMLADDKNTSIETKQMIALVVAHELSHQWFGNLVTMKWWDDLWLNESFANLMEYRAIDELFPDWKIWEQFVIGEGASAKRRDSLVEVQPIRTTVTHPDEISTLFDPSIVYAKGGTVLYMLKNYIGEEAFRAGLKQYFYKHKYGNTEATDLWEALGESSNKDISQFMSRWINAPGYPIVQVDWQPGEKDIKLSQRRFVSDPAYVSINDEPWHIPLAPTLKLKDLLLSSPENLTSLLGISNHSPLLFNHDGTSYFLPRYSNSKHFLSIVNAIKQGQVSNIDRLLIVDNYNLLQRGGEASIKELLDLLTAFESENNESVWSSLSLALSEVRRLIEGDSSEEKLDGLIVRLIQPLVEKIGWHDDPHDDAHTLRLRGLALSLAAAAKFKPVIQEGLRYFSFANSPSELAASTRGVVYFIAARHGTKDDFNKLLDMHKTSTNADERDELASGLTSVTDPKHFEQLIDMLKTEEIRRQDLMHWWVWLLRNRYSREAAWNWLTDNWGWIEKEFASDKSYGYFARYSGGLYSRPDEFRNYKEFFEPKKDIVALNREINLGEQEILSRIAWRERNEQSAKQWLNNL